MGRSVRKALVPLEQFEFACNLALQYGMMYNATRNNLLSEASRSNGCVLHLVKTPIVMKKYPGQNVFLEQGHVGAVETEFYDLTMRRLEHFRAEGYSTSVGPHIERLRSSRDAYMEARADWRDQGREEQELFPPLLGPLLVLKDSLRSEDSHYDKLLAERKQEKDKES